jgi:hypothetical protein
MDFKHAQVWIQLWNLKIHCKTINMGKHLGTQLGRVEDAALYDYPQKARIVKIKVSLNVEEPIRPGLFIGNTTDGITWVDFRYENLPMFCFGCGLVGHTVEKCSNNTMPLPEGAVNPRGPWLRSNIYGKRVTDRRDKRFNSNPLQSASGGQFSPIPKVMLDMLAKMKLEEEQEAEEPTGPTNKTNSQKQDMTRDETMNKLTHTPTMSKRKFQRTQGTSHLMEASTTNPHQGYLEVSLDTRANQGI